MTPKLIKSVLDILQTIVDHDDGTVDVTAINDAMQLLAPLEDKS